MKSSVWVAPALLACAVFSMNVSAADYKIDKRGQHAFVNFKASHLGYSYIIGRFNDFDGNFSHDAKNPSSASVEVTINTKSLDTNHAERDKHLRSGDFFNVDKHPTAKFKSTSFDGKKLMGDLTLMGVTKAVAIDVQHIGEGKDPWGGYRSGFVGTTSLNAADYGLPKWVGQVSVELNIEGVKK